MKFCTNCGTKLRQKEELLWWCQGCQANVFANPKPATEMLLYRDGKLLISQRGIEPGKGKFDMPGGFVELYEDAETALFREAEEELGITRDCYEGLEYLRSYNVDYPYGGVVHRVLVLVYSARLKDGVSVQAQDDVAALRWIEQEEIESVNWSHLESKKNAVAAFEKIIKS